MCTFTPHSSQSQSIVSEGKPPVANVIDEMKESDMFDKALRGRVFG